MNSNLYEVQSIVSGLDKPVHLIVESPGIGIGKTTLCKHLETVIPNSLLAEEMVDGDVLSTIYKELASGNKPSGSLFQAEIYFFFSRILQHVLFNFKPQKLYIYDRYMTSTLAFTSVMKSEGLLTPEQYSYLKGLHDKINGVSTLNKGNTIVIHLKAPVGVQLQRIKERGRPAEKDISGEYLCQLENEYHIVWDTFEKMGIPITTVDWKEFNRPAFYHVLSENLKKLST